mgnify:FL=1
MKVCSASSKQTYDDDDDKMWASKHRKRLSAKFTACHRISEPIIDIPTDVIAF